MNQSLIDQANSYFEAAESLEIIRLKERLYSAVKPSVENDGVKSTLAAFALVQVAIAGMQVHADTKEVSDFKRFGALKLQGHVH